MRFGDIERPSLFAGLASFSRRKRPLLGVQCPERQRSLIEQIVDSMRRIEYVRRLVGRELSEYRAEPESELFDPLGAALLRFRAGDLDEALWLTFLATHCGRHRKDRWQLIRDLYGGYGGAGRWTWARVSGHPADFQDWLSAQYPSMQRDGVSRRFGNHRKYETLRPNSARSTGRVIQSYVAWVGANRGHRLLIEEARKGNAADAKALFDHLYHSMAAVLSYGRTARFDFLTMAGNLQLLSIEPGIPYLKGATGPLAGARLLFGGAPNARLSAEVLVLRFGR